LVGVPGLDAHVLVLNWRDTGHPDGGGSEVYVERIAAELVARGYRATMFCASHGEAPAQEQSHGGITILRRGGRHTVYLRAAQAYISGALGFGPLSRRKLGRPDVIVDVGNGIPFLSKLYSRKPVLVLVHHVHREQWPVVMGRWMAKLGWWIESRLAIRVYRNCRYVTVSEATRHELGTLGVDPGRIVIVHNGTPDLPEIDARRDQQPSLLALGRLVPHKRVEIALRALARLRPDFPRLRLTIAGTGWWEAHLREYAQELGVTDHVHFAGFVSQEEKQRLLGRAWIALTPSLKEGWGLTIVEAAARGTPTVAFASAGGVAEALVDGKTGLLASDEDHFVKLVQELLVDAARREAMGEAARVHAGSFTWPAAGDEFADLIAGLLADRPAAAAHGNPSGAGRTVVS
jgi:glycosyltransferase involved in cell wall biosynthesis